MKITRMIALAAAALLGACGSGGEPEPTPEPAQMIHLEDWVASMIATGEIDTVEDKVAILIDTDDPNAFANLFPPAPADE